MYRLIFQQRDVARQPFTGDPGSLCIGRDPGCGLRLTEAGVREQHAAIDRRETGYFLRDLAKSNSVRVNGDAVTERRLATGDELEIGAVRLVFEVVQEPPPERRSFDPWQLLAGIVVVALVIGQIGLYGWIFLQSHPRNMRTDIASPHSQIKAPEQPPAATALLPLVPSVPLPPAPAAVTPEILSRQLKIVRAERQDEPTGVTIHLQVRAQVGERELDPKAIAISVQFFTPPAKPASFQWLAIPASWENFNSKQMIAHYTGAPAQCAGFVVRTYYHNQLEDVVATPATLASAALAPPLP